VERLLREYLYLRSNLDSRAQQPPTVIIDTESGRKPGAPNPRDNPFSSKPRSTPPRDGKKNQRDREEVWVSLLDLEAGLRQLSDDDLELVYKVLMLEMKTPDQLCKEFGASSTHSLERRCGHVVDALTRIMNGRPA
jgi:hypothetical protein